jgi:hypothetical protein
MRRIHLTLIAVLGLTFAGCAGPTRTASTAAASSSQSEAAAPGAPLTCGKNQHVCTSCDGRFQFCGEFCPDCIPPAHEPAPGTPSEIAATGASGSATATLALRGDACADRSAPRI